MGMALSMLATKTMRLKSLLLAGLVILTVAGGLAGCGQEAVNRPFTQEDAQSNTLFTAFTQRSPKYLDPARSYSTDETPFTYSIYEPLYGYHYLKRPYELIPRTAQEVVQPYYLDEHGQLLPEDAPGELVAESIYQVKLKPDILYQPHPAFARDDEGNYHYYPIEQEQLDGVFEIPAFEYHDTRPLTAEDYVYGFKRLASPRVVSPIYELFSKHIVGLEEFAAQAQALNEQTAADEWLDLRSIPLAGVEALDEQTLRFRVKGKYPQFSYWLAMTFAAPIAWEVDRFYQQPGMARHNLSLNQWPVGTGPYMLTESITNRRHVLSKNPNFRGEPYPCEGEPGDEQAGLLADCGELMPFIDRIVFQLEKESVPLLGKFLQGYYDIPQIERGEYGVSLTVAADDSPDKAALYQDRGIQLFTQPEAQLFYFGFNWLDPVVGKGETAEQEEKNRYLRQALSIAFDWEQYVAIFHNDQASVGHGPLPPGVYGHVAPPEGINPVVYELQQGYAQRRSLDEAKELLALAGYPEGRDAQTGEPLILYFDSAGGMGSSAMLDWMRRQLGQLGIQLEVRATDYNRFQEKMQRGVAQMFMWGWVADYPDAENFLFLLYGPHARALGGGENAANYQNDEYDALFEQMRYLDDGPEKQALIDEMVRIVQEDAPWMFGFTPYSGGAYQHWVRNAKPSQMVRDTLQYMRVDVDERVRSHAQWNQPVWWPLWLAMAVVVLMGGYLIRIWRARDLQRITQHGAGDRQQGGPHA